MNRSKPLVSKTRLQAKTQLKRTRKLAPGTPKPRARAPRAASGTMKGAVVLVLAGQATVAQAARELDVDPGRLEERCAREFRRICMERDNWTCQECGAVATEVQHRVARGAGGTSDPVVAFSPANGVGLCGDSHRLAESRDQEMHDRGFWLRQDEDPAGVPVRARTEYGHEVRWLRPDGTVSLTGPAEVAA